MDEGITAATNLNECTKLQEARDPTLNDIAWLDQAGHVFDDLTSGITTCTIGSGDMNRAILLDINLRARFSTDLLDVLATWSDDSTNLLWINLEGNDAWSVLGHLLTWSADGFVDLAKDVQACFKCLCKPFNKDITGNALNLGVELQRGDTVSRTGNLEVHVSREVFHSLNVSKDCVLTRCFIGD